ncbi:MAG: DedA family protein [Nitrospira sp.]|nr:DedA family protein [Nitrospira sp.]
MSGALNLVTHFPYMGLFILLILGGFGLPLPEDTTLILCGFLISQGIIKPVPALLVVYTGILLGDLTLYTIGRKYGRKIVTHKKFHGILSPEKFSVYEERFKKRGILFILFGRHLIGLRTKIFLVAGIVHMSVFKFVITDAVSSLLTITVMVIIGYTGGNSLQIILKDMRRVEHLILFAVLSIFTIGFTVFLIIRYRKSKQDKTLL